MGKRRATKKAKKTNRARYREPLPKQFDCPMCAAQSSCLAVLNTKTGFGSISCRDCNELFQTSVDKISEPIDVYFAWTDALDAMADDTDADYYKKKEEDDRKKREPASDDDYSDEILKDESDSEKEEDGDDIKEEDDSSED